MSTTLQEELASGLQRLLALRLRGQPAQDVIESTLAAWYDAVLRRGVTDRDRLRHAFVTLSQTCTHWPAPKELIDAIPSSVDNTTKLPPPRRSERATALKNIARLRELIKAGAVVQQFPEPTREITEHVERTIKSELGAQLTPARHNDPEVFRSMDFQGIPEPAPVSTQVDIDTLDREPGSDDDKE